MSKGNYPSILILTGASGAGKTTLLLKLDDLQIPGLLCVNCDRVDLGLDKSIDSSDRQTAVLQHWIREIKERDKRVDLAVLDTQIRPHRAVEILNEEGIEDYRVVLVDCEPFKRNERLRNERQQPALVNHQMDCWAAYLRGQADALDLPIIDTSEDFVDDSLKRVLSFVERPGLDLF